MISLGSLGREACSALSSIYPPEEARAIVLRLVEHCLGIPTYKYMAEPSMDVDGSDGLAAFRSAVESLLTGRPLQYVQGFAEFCGHKFRVGEGCLIPRPETEEMVSRIIDECSSLEIGDEPFNILDICTGSGCIAWSLASAFPSAMVYACDLSPDALAFACKQRVKVQGARPIFFAADVLAEPPAGLPQFDIIVSNPPYVLDSERSQMHRNVLDFEPSMALFVPDDDPLKFYRAIAAWSSRLLRPAGRIYLEINERLASETSALFPGSKVLDDFRSRPRFLRA